MPARGRTFKVVRESGFSSFLCLVSRFEASAIRCPFASPHPVLLTSSRDACSSSLFLRRFFLPFRNACSLFLFSLSLSLVSSSSLRLLSSVPPFLRALVLPPYWPSLHPPHSRDTQTRTDTHARARLRPLALQRSHVRAKCAQARTWYIRAGRFTRAYPPPRVKCTSLMMYLAQGWCASACTRWEPTQRSRHGGRNELVDEGTRRVTAEIRDVCWEQNRDCPEIV